MKNILNVVLAASFMLGLASCESELDIAKHGNMGTIEDFYKTDEDAESAAASMYLQWRNIVIDEFNARNLMSDDIWCGGGSRGDVGTMEALNEFTHGTENPYVQSLYEGYYKVIYQANLILTYLDENGSAVFKRNRAEALVARGYAHMMLGIYFGTAPVVTEILTGGNVRPSSSEKGKLYEQAVADLTAAIKSNCLTVKKDLNDNSANNRITVDAAKAFLGKTYLFMGDKANAASVLDEIITSGRYDLLPTEEYENLHHAVANNCKEDIFQLQKRNNNALVWAEYIGNTLELMSGWRSDNMVYVSGSKAEADRGGTSSYGFMNPTSSLWNAFVAAGEEDSPRRLATLRNDAEIKEYGISFVKGTSLYGHEGYYLWKYRMIREDCMDPYGMAGYQITQYNNMKEMRYAEVLLMAAEAHNGDAKSLEYLNEVHKRATGGETFETYSLEALKTEKRLELCVEGTRFEDLVRWGDAASVLGAQAQKTPQFTAEGKVEWPSQWNKPAAGFKSGKHELLPIPQTEIDINPNIQQNDGWK